MDTTSHRVRDMAASDRAALERLVGQSLNDNQQVVIQVLPPVDKGSEEAKGDRDQPSTSVPAYWRVFEGMTEAQLDQLDATLAERPAFSRPGE